MVDRPPEQGIITPEIAETYGRSLHTVTKVWTRHPDWPAPIDRRGRHKEYDRDQVAAWVRDHAERPAVDLESDRLYTAQQLEAASIGITAGTIRADRSRGRWPAPDDTAHGTDRWRGRTITEHLAARRSYRRTTP